eukprot:6324964-Pyramimonas_sp.AAC.1
MQTSAPPSVALRGPTGSSTEGRSGTARMRHPQPSTALRGLMGSCTESIGGCTRMRFPTHYTVSLP